MGGDARLTNFQYEPSDSDSDEDEEDDEDEDGDGEEAEEADLMDGSSEEFEGGPQHRKRRRANSRGAKRKRRRDDTDDRVRAFQLVYSVVDLNSAWPFASSRPRCSL